MAANSTHADYDAAAPEWARARDVLAGEDAVKAAGERYLARLDSQSDEEYVAYRARASFFGATARTLEEFLDLVFRRAPAFALGATAGKLAEGLKAFVEDFDLSGTDFVRYARRVLREVLSVGRVGTLVLVDSGSGRPWVSLWRAEQIVNWEIKRVGERSVLSCVVLKGAERVRVLQLEEGEGGALGEHALPGCVMEVWRAKHDDSQSPIADGDGERRAEDSPALPGWEVEERVALKRDGVPLSFISFVFHGPRHSGEEPDRLPLADIIAANLDHYRLDADYKHGLHFAALPTAWVSGFDKAAPLRIGSSTAWVSEVPGASAGFLEFTGAGLGHLEKAMEKVERRMALLGARMLERSDASGEGTSGDGQMCGLGAIVANLNRSLSRVLQVAEWWMQGGDLDAQGAGFAMNTDLGARAMSGEEITAVVAAWRAGAISRESRLKRGEVLPDGRSVAQERALIHGKRQTDG